MKIVRRRPSAAPSLPHRHLTGDGARPSASLILWVALLALATSGLVAPADALARQDPAPPAAASGAEPEFLIESIVVEGSTRISTEILVSQARLVEGGSYTEAQIHEAVARIRQLPFVLDAEPRLRRGSERGRYQLVLAIVPTSRFFSSYALFGSYFDKQTLVSPFPGPDGEPQEPVEIGGDLEISSERFELGYRFFVGSNGVAFVAGDSGLGVSVGYTQYRLLDTNAYLSVALRRAQCCDRIDLLDDDDDLSGFASDGISLSLVLGIPVAPRQSIQLEGVFADTDSRSETVFVDPGEPNLPTPVPTEVDTDTRALGVRWIRDTTDEPILPRSGSRILAGVSAQRRETSGGLTGVPDLDSVGAAFSSVRYRPWGRRNAWSLGFDAAFGRNEQIAFGAPGIDEIDVVSGSVTGGLYRTFRLPRSGRGGELRGELTGTYSTFDSSPENPFRIQDDDSVSLFGSLVYRNRFTVLRLGLGWVDGVGR